MTRRKGCWKFKLPMPDQGLSESEVARLIRYFHWFHRQGKPAPRRLSKKSGG